MSFLQSLQVLLQLVAPFFLQTPFVVVVEILPMLPCRTLVSGRLVLLVQLGGPVEVPAGFVLLSAQCILLLRLLSGMLRALLRLLCSLIFIMLLQNLRMLFEPANERTANIWISVLWSTAAAGSVPCNVPKTGVSHGHDMMLTTVFSVDEHCEDSPLLRTTLVFLLFIQL